MKLSLQLIPYATNVIHNFRTFLHKTFEKAPFEFPKNSIIRWNEKYTLCRICLQVQIYRNQSA